MYIITRVYLEAKDRMDADAMKPDYVTEGSSFDSVIEGMGSVERAILKVASEPVIPEGEEANDQDHDCHMGPESGCNHPSHQNQREE